MTLLLLFVGNLLTTSSQSFSQNQPVVSLDSISIGVNTEFILPIQFSGLDSIDATAYQFTLSYESSFLTIDSVNTQDTASEFGLIQVNTDTPGILRIAAAQNQSLPSSGLLVELYGSSFTQTGPVSIQFDSFQFNEGEVDVKAVHGVVDVRETAAEFYISADTITVSTKQVFDLSINIKHANQPLYSGMFTILYDPELIFPIDLSIEKTLLDIPEAIVDYSISSPGHLHVLFASSSALTNQDMPLIRPVFESAERHGESPINLVDISLNEIDTATLAKDGLVYITPPFVYGDTNEDLEITIIDAVLILKHLLQLTHLTEVAQQAADVSGNNSITSYDAALIMRYNAGTLLCFPVEPGCSVHKHQHGIMEAHSSVITPIIRSTINTSPQQSTVILDLSENLQPVYSLDISIPIEAGWNPDLDIVSHLTKEWIIATETSESTLRIKTAGPTPFSGGPILSIPENITEASISINGSSSVIPIQIGDHHDLVITDVFPTPFDQSVSLYFSLGRASDVSISLYDMLGRRVKQILQDYIGKGEHHVNIEGHLLSPGVYLIQVATPDGLSDKISIIKR